MLKIENVTINYSSQILGPFNLEVQDNQIISFIGSSGAGKSTLIKAIAGVVEFEGKIQLHQNNISPSNYTYITQSGTLFNHLTVKENLELTVLIDDASNAFDAVGLDISNLDKYPFELSGGERQRIDLIRGILAQAKILILDESFNSLDTKTKEDIYQTLINMQKKYKMLILIITHDLEEATILSDYIVLVEDGTITFNGTTKQFLKYDNEAITNFISPRKIRILQEYNDYIS